MRNGIVTPIITGAPASTRVCRSACLIIPRRLQRVHPYRDVRNSAAISPIPCLGIPPSWAAHRLGRQVGQFVLGSLTFCTMGRTAPIRSICAYADIFNGLSVPDLPYCI